MHQRTSMCKDEKISKKMFASWKWQKIGFARALSQASYSCVFFQRGRKKTGQRHGNSNYYIFCCTRQYHFRRSENWMVLNLDECHSWYSLGRFSAHNSFYSKTLPGARGLLVYASKAPGMTTVSPDLVSTNVSPFFTLVLQLGDVPHPRNNSWGVCCDLPLGANNGALRLLLLGWLRCFDLDPSLWNTDVDGEKCRDDSFWGGNWGILCLSSHSSTRSSFLADKYLCPTPTNTSLSAQIFSLQEICWLPPSVLWLQFEAFLSFSVSPLKHFVKKHKTLWYFDVSIILPLQIVSVLRHPPRQQPNAEHHFALRCSHWISFWAAGEKFQILAASSWSARLVWCLRRFLRVRGIVIMSMYLKEGFGSFFDAWSTGINC